MTVLELGEMNPGFVPEERNASSQEWETATQDSDSELKITSRNSSTSTNNNRGGIIDGESITVIGRKINSQDLEEKEEEKKKFNLKFSKRQWTFLLIYGLTNVCRGAWMIISGPFYPKEAEKRGVTDTEIGFVFGSLDFSTFLVCLFFGKFIIPKFGPRLVFTCSSLNLSICNVLFGCLELIEDKTLFLTFSFIIRIIVGIGDAGFYPSAFVIFAEEFEGNVGTAIGLFEFLFGVGAILGPIIFGSFYDAAGFLAVYSILGFLIFCCVLLTHFCTPGKMEPQILKSASEDFRRRSTMSNNKYVGNTFGKIPTKNWSHIFLIPAVLLAMFNLLTTAASIGFISTTLSNHLDQFNLSTFQSSAVFTVSNGLYTVLTPVCGAISDKLKGIWKNGIIFGGSGLVLLGFSFLGPLPFLSDKSYLWSTLVGLILHGIGIGGAVMSAYPHSVEAAISEGFSDSEETYSLISSVYTLTFTLGNSVGPAIAGILVDNIQFQNATFFIVGLAALVIIFALLLTLRQIKRGRL